MVGVGDGDRERVGGVGRGLARGRQKPADHEADLLARRREADLGGVLLGAHREGGRLAREAEAARWEKVISQFTSSTPLGRPERISIRLVVRPDQAHLEWKSESGGDNPVFLTIEKPELQRFMTLARQSLLGVVPEAANVLWLTYLNHWQQFQVLGEITHHTVHP